MEVTFHKEEIARFLHIPCEGLRPHEIVQNSEFDWTPVNLVIRKLGTNSHIGLMEGLTHEARIVQHGLRYTLVPKAGDRLHISPLLSIITYFILTKTSFDATDLLLRNLQFYEKLRDPSYKKKHNLFYGHVLQFLLSQKFQITSSDSPDHIPQHFTDRDFLHVNRSGEGRSPHRPDSPASQPAPPRHSFAASSSEPWLPHFQEVNARIDSLAENLQQFSLQQQQHYLQEQEWHMQQLQWQQKYEEDQIFIRQQLDDLRQPPTDPDFNF